MVILYHNINDYVNKIDLTPIYRRLGKEEDSYMGGVRCVE
jgi:hypothetical protein